MTAGNEMKELISPLNPYGIHYFTYNKNYLNGKRIRLTTHADHLKAFLANEYYKVGNIDAHPTLYSNQIVMTSTFKNQALVQWIKEDFNVDNIIYIIRQGEDYTEFFSFGTSRNKPQIINFYLTNMNLLQGFCDYVKTQAAGLLTQAEKNTLIHDYHKEGIQTYCPEEIKDYLMFKKYHITSREQQIIPLLVQGMRAKEIAKTLNISYRTIEDYLSQLKRKLKVRNLIELVVKITKYH